MQKVGSHCSGNKRKHKPVPDKHEQIKYMAQLFKVTPSPLVSIQTKPHEQLKAEIFQLHIQEEEQKGKEKKQSKNKTKGRHDLNVNYQKRK